MKLSDLTNHAGEWLRGSGPMSEVVISSRIRLARNFAGYPFLARCSRGQRTTIEHKTRDTILQSQVSANHDSFQIDGLSFFHGGQKC